MKVIIYIGIVMVIFFNSWNVTYKNLYF